MIRKNLFSLLIAIIILYLSLANSKNFDRVQVNIPNADKLVHFGMYFSLMTAILIENRYRIKQWTTVLLLSLIPFSYGIIIEMLQYFTATRTPDIQDAIADAAGVIFSLALWLLVKPARWTKSE